MDALRPDLRARMSSAHRADLEALAALGPRKYTVLATDRRPPVTSVGFSVKTPKESFIYYFGRDDSGLISGIVILDIVDYSKL